MVYTTQRFRIIPNPAAQPISVGEEGVPTAGGPLDWLLNFFQGGAQYPPVQFPTPGTGEGTGLEEPPTTTTCPTGYAWNSTTSQCVLIPTGGAGQITEVQVPTTSNVGSPIVIKTWVKNTTLGTLVYTVTVSIPGLGINTTSPALSVAAGQIALIETTITIPSTAVVGSYAGVVTVYASNQIHDTEPFTLSVSGAGTGAATIVPSATTVLRGNSISIACTGFGASEFIDFVAKVGTTVVSTDNKQTGTNGSIVLDTLTFYSSSPTGTAVITATGRTSGRIATASVTVTSSTTTGGTASISTNKSSYVKGQTISVTGSGYLAGEKVKLWLSKDGVTRCSASDMTANSSGAVSGSINACYAPSDGGTVNVRGEGRTSKRMGVRGIKITSTTTTTTTAKISAPSSVHDGDTFTITGTGFKGGESVKTYVTGVWKSSSSSYNNKPFSSSVTKTASSSGSFSATGKTPEVPSGVSATATIKSVGLSSGRQASRTISVI
jgi:hypothetical protein